MEKRLYLDILPQPDDTTCGPTCLHAVFRYFDEQISLDRVISEITYLESGGTLAVYLANHALRRGYRATIYTYNVQVFDPTWFAPGGPCIRQKLKLQLQYKTDHPELEAATHGYMEFLELGGQIRFEALTAGLIRRYLNRSIPILTGLCATYLYHCAREYFDGRKLRYDDVRGKPMGHFVVLAGYNRENREALIADPLMPNPLSPGQYYHIHVDRLVCAIMLGILTYDANLLIIEPRKKRGGYPKSPHPHPTIFTHWP